MERFYEEFNILPKEQQEFIKAIMAIMQSDKDLNLKTEIANPPIHSTLDLLAIYYDDLGQKEASKYLKFYSKSLKEQMVSFKREGRTEFKDMLSAGLQGLFNRDRSITDRLTGKRE